LQTTVYISLWVDPDSRWSHSLPRPHLCVYPKIPERKKVLFLGDWLDPDSEEWIWFLLLSQSFLICKKEEQTNPPEI
jgi:hypothetical protein